MISRQGLTAGDGSVLGLLHQSPDHMQMYKLVSSAATQAARSILIVMNDVTVD